MTFHVPQRGRPRTTEGTKRIILRESTFRLWNERKERLNIKGLSNSQFAEVLLHQNIEELRARSSSYQESPAEKSVDNGPSSSKISVLFIYFPSRLVAVSFWFFKPCYLNLVNKKCFPLFSMEFDFNLIILTGTGL